MKVSIVLSVCVVTLACLVSVPSVQGQLDPGTILSIVNSMPRWDKLLLFSDMLDRHPLTYQDIENTLVSFLPVLEFDKPPGHFMNPLLSWALNHLPNVLKNENFLGIMKIFITELNNHNATDEWRLNTGNLTEDRDHYVSKLLSVLDYYGMGISILQMRSSRTLFPYNSTTRPLDEQCYTNTMDFIDRMMHGDEWAFNMFDAIGKPTTGIRRGVLYFIGTYDQCLNVHADIPVNASLGELKADTHRQFQGKYCRATFVPPTALVASIAGKHINKTYGVPLTLSLGMCLPSTCQGEDIEGLLNLGILGSLFNISVDKHVCLEEKDFKQDTESHVVIGILGGIILIMMISSTIDLFFLKSKRETNSKDPKHIYSLSGMAHHDNKGFIDINGVAGEEKIEQTKITTITDKVDETKKVNGITKNGHIGNTTHNESLDSDLTNDVLDEHEEKPIHSILRSFSIFTNIPSALSTDTKYNDIPCLYGLRVLSIMLIVLGNTFLYVAQSLSEVPVAVDMMDSFSLMNRWTMQFVMSASLATDTFFMISGCLISYWFLLKEEDGTEASLKSWLKFYAGKYWKMTPPYMLVMVTFVYLYMYLGEGPLWPENIAVADSCRNDWWKHLLYINNLLGADGVPAEDQCMTWSWYIAVNMQFYLIAPVILTFMTYSSPMGLAINGVIMVAGLVSAGIKESHYGGEILTSRMDGGEYWNNIFIKPWCRVSTFCIGIYLGYIIQKLNHIKLHKIIGLLLWVVAVCLAILVMYIPYTKFIDNAEPWTNAQQAAYESLGRPVWAISMAWIVYACHSGLGGPLSDFLSWKGFIPLSRLTYLVYLIHPVLMVLVVYSRRTLVHLNDFEMAYQFIGHMVVNFVAAFMAALAFDLPFRNIKRIFHKKKIDEPY